MVNEEIQGNVVAVIDDGNMSNMSLDEALNLARSEDLDLVQVSTKDGVALCKLMDYNKFLYSQKKKDKGNKGKQELKEIRLSDTIAANDLKIKAKNVDRLLGEGDKVKVVITYKGRSIAFITRGVEKLNSFEQMIESAHAVDRAPKIEGNRVYMVVSPKR